MAAVSEESGAVDVSATRPVSQVAKAFTKFREQDVLFAKITPCMENGKIAVVPPLPTGVGAGSTEFHVIRPRALNPRFVFHFLAQRAFRQEARRNMSGSAGQLRVPTEYLRDHAIPVPPLDVQHQIVARIEALFAEIEEGEEALAAARAGVETYRKALLKAAVTGELTADWRKANPAAETGPDLLRRILADRRARWEANPKNRGKRYVEPAGPVADALPDLPEGWCWARLEQLTIDGPSNGYSPKASHDGSGTKALKLTATSGGRMRLDPDCVKTLGEEIKPESDLFLVPGDLLFQRGNTRELVGIAAVYDGPANRYIYPDLMIRVRTSSPALSVWLWRWANSPHGRAHMMAKAQGAAGSMPKISGQTLRDMPVPVCSEAELNAALNMIEQGLSANDAGADQMAAAGGTTLRQSILAAAFRGDLAA